MIGDIGVRNLYYFFQSYLNNSYSDKTLTLNSNIRFIHTIAISAIAVLLTIPVQGPGIVDAIGPKQEDLTALGPGIVDAIGPKQEDLTALGPGIVDAIGPKQEDLTAFRSWSWHS